MRETEKINIRKAKESDLEEIYQFEREYIIEHEPNQLEKWDAIKDKTMTLLTSNLGRMFVASVDGCLAGHCYWSLYQEEACVYSIYISKVFRKMGIASRIITETEKDIFDCGHNKVTLSTLVTNPAQHLFDKMDYERLEVKDGWIYYSKSKVDLGYG